MTHSPIDDDDPRAFTRRVGAASDALTTLIRAPRVIDGEWHSATLVLSHKDASTPVQGRLFGCHPSVRLDTGPDFQRTASSCLAVVSTTGSVFHLAITVYGSSRPVGGQSKAQANIEVNVDVPGWSIVFAHLEWTVADRARLSPDPADHSEEAIIDVMRDSGVGGPGDDVPESPSYRAAAEQVLAQALRRASPRLSAGVVVLTHNRIGGGCQGTVVGEFREPEAPLRICASGDARRAAELVLTDGADPSHAPRPTFILFARRPTGPVWRVTRDPTVAFRFMDVTERARLRDLGLLPNPRLRRV